MIRIGPEDWGDMEDEALALGEAHFHEASVELPDCYQYDPNVELLYRLAQTNAQRSWSVREGGRLVGYLLFFLYPDIQSAEVLVADQGPWYVRPGTRGLVGLKMLKRAVADLKADGVRVINLCHPVVGRGAKLGLAFARMGAVEKERKYVLYS